MVKPVTVIVAVILAAAVVIHTGAVSIWLWNRFKEPNIIQMPMLIVPINECKDAAFWNYPNR